MEFFTVSLTEEKEEFILEVVTVFDLLFGEEGNVVLYFWVAGLAGDHFGEIFGKFLKVENFKIRSSDGILDQFSTKFLTEVNSITVE